MTGIEEMHKVESCFWCKSAKFSKITERKDGVGIQECQVCGLIQVADIPDDLSVYYVEENYFNPDGETKTGYHESYDLLSPFYLYWQGALIEELSRKVAAERLLEVGCATGNALEMVNLFLPNIHAEGIDLSDYGIEVCRQKGLQASVSTIEDYKSDNKFDVIFSSETMEHVDNVRSFVQAVENNLSSRGAFVFYVPAVHKADLIKEGPDYPSLTTSLEHVSYFTNAFLTRAMKEQFGDAAVYVHTISTDGESYHLGIVSANTDLVRHMKKFIRGIEVYTPSFKDEKTLYNTTTLSAKFGNFDAAHKYLDQFVQSYPNRSHDANFLNGILSYNKGEVIKAQEYFNKALEGRPPTNFDLRVFLATEKSLTEIYANEIETLRQQTLRLNSVSEELEELKHSFLVGNTLKIRRLIGRLINPIKNFKKKNIAKTRNTLIRLIPASLRKYLKYVITLKFLIKYEEVENTRDSRGACLVSVVIPYYNRADTIDETIASLGSQTFTDFEVILVDDGSTQAESIKKLDKLHTGELRFSIIRQSNSGVASARNKGIKQSKGKYIICLDSDDILDPTYIEKCVLVLETDPNIDIATTHISNFGVINSIYYQSAFDAGSMLDNNTVITAAMFRRDAWHKVGGYKSGIGYEDWEFWINLTENGFWGKLIPEPIFNYRTAVSSRFIDDRADHSSNMKKIRNLHPAFAKNLRRKKIRKYFHQKVVRIETSFSSLNNADYYRHAPKAKGNVLIAMPWMTFGGAETLILNFCNEIKDAYNLSFITGLPSGHEWEYKFKQISPNVYHLANLFEDQKLYLEFISNFVKTRDINILHIIHTSFVFEMLPEIKKRHPGLKVIVTVFNDRAHFNESIDSREYVDVYTSDNAVVAEHYNQQLDGVKTVSVIPNGINSTNVFNPVLYNRAKERELLNINQEDSAVFFIGRLSEEKNPDVFLEAARKIMKTNDSQTIKFFIIGDGHMKSVVERMIDNIGHPNVTYLGYQTEIPRFLSAADIFVLPSSIEGFPLSILEAMAMRVAVVSSDVGAVSEVIESGADGFIVRPGSAEDIVNIIQKLHQEQDLLKEVKNKARAKIEKNYSNKVLGQNYKSLYMGLLK